MPTGRYHLHGYADRTSGLHRQHGDDIEIQFIDVIIDNIDGVITAKMFRTR